MMKRNDRDNEWNTYVMEDMISGGRQLSDLVRKAQADTLSGYLNGLMGRKGISTDAAAELSALNRASLYKIMNGSTKHPKRNVLLRIALTLGASFSETQDLLKLGGRASLSASRGRDIIISDGVIHSRPIDDINKQLNRYSYPDLYAKE